MFSYKQKVVALAGLLTAAAAHALPTAGEIFSFQDTAPNGVLTSDVQSEQRRMLSLLAANVAAFGFESGNVGETAPQAVDFAGSLNTTITATLTGGDGVIAGAANAGRFNTTADGSKYWAVRAGDAGTFTINFSEAISAFGFYGTDIGDFEGTLTLVLHSATGADEELVVRRGAAVAGGSLLFYGFADIDARYTSITFRSTVGGGDVFGFDDFIVADAGQFLPQDTPIPEPTSLALVGLALCAAGWSRKSAHTA